MWSEGKDSFKDDPPNAAITALGFDTQIVELNGIEVKQGKLIFPVTISADEKKNISPLKKEESLQNVSLFIDGSCRNIPFIQIFCPETYTKTIPEAWCKINCGPNDEKCWKKCIP